MTATSLADRMKAYERAVGHTLVRRVPVILRLDGRAFHTWTRGLDRPFDRYLSDAMRAAAAGLASEVQGFGAAYLQSDEASFLLTDYAKPETEPWFGYVTAKLCSIAASEFTADFNASALPWRQIAATFDCRAFNVPEADVPNYFLWRSRDWRRNSIQMLAQSVFSHRELHGKSIAEMLHMLAEEGHDWTELEPHWRLGSALRFDGWAEQAPEPTYAAWSEWLEPALARARGEGEEAS